MNGVTANVQRGCGRRKAGGIYAECPLGAEGSPLEDFIYDPPVEIPEDLAIAAQGVTLIEREGVTHLLDWVGAAHYPNVADFLEEVRRFGLSRRLPKTMDFGRLTVESRIILVHRRAILARPETYRQLMPAPVYDCPKVLHEHCNGGVMCAGLWWEDIAAPPGPVTRVMPAFEYEASGLPAGADTAARPGFFAAFPVAGLAVVRDPGESMLHERALAAIVDKDKPLGIPVELVDE